MDELDPALLKDLVARVAAKDADARDEFARRYYTRVRSIVHQTLEGDFRRRHRWILPLFSTQDMVHEVFVRVLDDLTDCEFEHEGALLSYLGTAIRHRLVDALRYHESAKRDQRRRADAPTAGVEQLHPGDADTPALAAVLSERAQVLQDVLQELPERQRLILQMRLVDNTPFNDIADALGFASGGSARNAFVDAQAKLLVRLRTRGVRPAGETLA